MKFLFVTYCFGDWAGQALIGVYKRGLRLALELCDRGHRVAFFCTGRQAYHDELTARAETRLDFLDFPFIVAAFEAAEENRRALLQEIAKLQADCIVIGEAPLAGALLESALCAVELGIPVVVLDNAYNPLFVEKFCEVHGPVADGIILTGPSSYHSPSPPAYLCQVPPYIDTAPQAAREMLTERLGLSGEKLITVLAYDSKVEKVGASLLEKLAGGNVEAVFLSRDAEKCQQRLARLSDSRTALFRVIPPPTDPILFGLLELSRLAIVKYGFMQVSECMALRTPVIVVYHEGPLWLDDLPEACRPFAQVITEAEADHATLAAAYRFLETNPIEMAGVHHGELGATAKAADFLEALPHHQRRETWTDCVRLGFREEYILAALRAQHPCETVRLHLLRSTYLRGLLEYHIYSVVCGYTVAGERQFARLWGRLYQSPEAVEVDARDATAQGRRVLYSSPGNRILIEADIGQAMLPPL